MQWVSLRRVGILYICECEGECDQGNESMKILETRYETYWCYKGKYVGTYAQSTST